MHKIGTRVNVMAGVWQAGTVCGHGFFESEHTGEMSAAYIVRLDRGVWTRDSTAFISVITVHTDNVEVADE